MTGSTRDRFRNGIAITGILLAYGLPGFLLHARRGERFVMGAEDGTIAAAVCMSIALALLVWFERHRLATRLFSEQDFGHKLYFFAAGVWVITLALTVYRLTAANEWWEVGIAGAALQLTAIAGMTWLAISARRRDIQATK